MISVTWLVTAFVALAIPLADTAQESDKQRLQGAWDVELAEVDGNPVYGFEGALLTLKDDTAILRSKLPSGEVDVDTNTYELSESQTPKRITLFQIEERKNGVQRGIYELQGDSLKICMAGPGAKEYPRDFKVKDCIILTLKRHQETNDRAAGGPAAQPSEEQAEWVSLFNGRDLTGWKVKIKGYDLNDNFGNTFRVEDGVLKVVYDKYDEFRDRFGHLFYEQPYSHYVLRVEYRFVGQQVPGGPGWALRNSGIMIHGQSPESMRKEQDFPVSIEVQLLGGAATGERHTANLCTPGTHVVMDGKLVTRHCNDSRSETYRGDQWVTVEIEVHGNRLIRHRVNGQVVLEYSQPQLDESDADAKRLLENANGDKMLSGGTISLQSESHSVEFRKVEIRQIKE